MAKRETDGAAMKVRAVRTHRAGQVLPVGFR